MAEARLWRLELQRLDLVVNVIFLQAHDWLRGAAKLTMNLLIPRLETQRLSRAFWSNLDAYAVCWSEVMRYIGNGQPLSRSESWRNMAMMLGHWQCGATVCGRWKSARVGWLVGLAGNQGWPGFEIGWTLRRAYWPWICNRSGEQRWTMPLWLEAIHVISLIRLENAASRRVAQKLGEKLEGTTEILAVRR